MNGDTLYVWQVLEENEWGTITAVASPPIAAADQSVVHVPLLARSLEIAHYFGIAAVAHHDRYGLPVRLARFDLSEVLRDVP